MIFLNRIFLATCAFIAPTIAQTLAFTNSFDGIHLGVPFDLTWTGDGTPVDLILQAGFGASSLVDVSPIASNVQSPYTITPPTSIPAGTYAIRISQSGLTALSPIFAISAAGMSTILFPTPTPSSATPAPTVIAPVASATPTVDDSGVLISAPTPAITASPTYVDSNAVMSALFGSAPPPSGAPGASLGASFAKAAAVPSSLGSSPHASPTKGAVSLPLPPARVGTAPGTGYPVVTGAAGVSGTYCNSTLPAHISKSTTTLPCPSGSKSAVGTGVVSSPTEGVKFTSGAGRRRGMGIEVWRWVVRGLLVAAAVGMVA